MHFLCDAGFENTFKTKDEHTPKEPLAELGAPIDRHIEWVLFKDPKFLSTDPVPEEERLQELEELLDHAAVHVVCMVRDPRGALLSRNPMYKPHTYQNQPAVWLRAARAIHHLGYHRRVLVVRYEDLLTSPNFIQRQLIWRFGLKQRLPFSRCWTDFDQEDVGSIKAMHGARPLDPSRAEPWKMAPQADREHLRRAFAQAPEMVPWMESFGYVFDGFGDD
jgi:hypothetical protein